MGICRVRPLLVAGDDGVHLFDVARGKRPLILYESEDALYRRLVIVDHGGYRLRVLAVSVRDQSRIYSSLDQQLRDAAVEYVETLDQTGLYGPLSKQPLFELDECILLLQSLALLLPHLSQMFQVPLDELSRIGLVITDEVPRVSH